VISVQLLRIGVGVLVLSIGALLPASHATPAEGGFTSQDVEFQSQGLTLAASLLLPAGEGPHPGIVIVHGSGTSPRSNPWTSAYAEAFARRGIAVLYPDKRGSGDSQGDWLQASFEDLARDALAAMERLLQEASVDPERTGLIGFSQGGDIVPIAATLSPKVQFVIDVSGSVVPILEQIGDEIRMGAVAEGVGAPGLEQLAQIHRRGCEYAVHGEGWSSYARELREAAQGPLKGTEALEGFPTDPKAPIWGFLRTVGDFDPLPYWRDVSVPVAFLYGHRDSNVDVAKSVRIIEENLMVAGASRSLLVFANNAHGLFRDDSLDYLARWIEDGGVD
jgi:hypothetical protein